MLCYNNYCKRYKYLFIQIQKKRVIILIFVIKTGPNYI